MTLPAGQISLSEVNVELGYSATALITMNDTAVRNLAGVPSGQISMSNLQGKSANSYFIIYGGPKTTSGVNTVGSFSGGIIASEQGTVVTGTIGTGPTNQISYFSNDGTIVTSTKNATNTGFPIYVTTDASNPKWYSYHTYYQNYVTNNAKTTWGWASSVRMNSNAPQSPDFGQLSVNGNGVVAILGTYTPSKQGYPQVGLLDSSGNLLSGVGITANGPAFQYSTILARTDNTFIYFRGVGSNFKSWIVTPNSATPANTAEYSGGTGGAGFAKWFLDSSNNMYSAAMPTAYDRVEVIRVNSSRVPTHLKRWDVASGGYNGYNLDGQYINQCAQYGSYVYIANGAYTGTPRQGYFFVVCLNASDLSFAWGKSFTSTGWGVGGANSYASVIDTQYPAMYANQYGLWITWIAGTTNTNQQETYLMKLPLNGSVTNGTYSVGGKNIVIANYTPTFTNLTPPTTYSTYSLTTTSRTTQTSSPPAISTGTVTSLTKTALT